MREDITDPKGFEHRYGQLITVLILEPYYQNDQVRSRMVEFLGGTFLADATCAFIVGGDGPQSNLSKPRDPSELPNCLLHHSEVSRSLWDHRFLIAHLDIEYVNFDFPGEAYLNPARSYCLQQPVVRAVEELLLGWGIAPLHLLTGRGHHFTWSIAQDSAPFRQLAALGKVPESLQQRYGRYRSPGGGLISEELGRAFAGLGILMEYVGQRVKQVAANHCDISVQLTDVEVGGNMVARPASGREVISIDVSEYADPLQTRHIRVPFSFYLKPQANREQVGQHVVDAVPLIIEIPLFEMSEGEAICVMRDVDRAAELASRASVRIPDQTAATGNLIEEYRGSNLANFHRWFYQQEQHPPDAWEATYDQVELSHLPTCAREMLLRPNPLLLKPAGIQHIVRVFISQGWHPRQIAGLIRSKYERDFGWGHRWFDHDATNRADWYTRLFAGQIFTGVDQLVDLNCISQAEKGYCFQPLCGHNLADYRDTLRPLENT